MKRRELELLKAQNGNGGDGHKGGSGKGTNGGGTRGGNRGQ